MGLRDGRRRVIALTSPGINLIARLEEMAVIIEHVGINHAKYQKYPNEIIRGKKMAAVHHLIDPPRLTIFFGRIGNLDPRIDLTIIGSNAGKSSFSIDGHNLDSRAYNRSIDGSAVYREKRMRAQQGIVTQRATDIYNRDA